MTEQEHQKMHENGVPHSHEHSHEKLSNAGATQSEDKKHLAGYVHSHSYTDEDGVQHFHTHKHQPDNTTMVVNRLARAIGHLESVKRMVESGKDCAEILIQLSAVKSAVNNTGKIILKDHLESCIIEAIENDDEQAILDLEHAIDHFIS